MGCLSRSFRSTLGLLGVLAGICPAAHAGEDLTERFRADVHPVLERYCFGCHGEERQKANFRIDMLDPDLLTGPDAEAWSHVLDVVNLGDMPPRRADQLEDDQRRALVTWLDDALAAASRARSEELEPVLRRQIGRASCRERVS